MDKFINAEAFKRKLIAEKNFFPTIVARALEEMPSADVAEVKHGEWLLIINRSDYLEPPSCDTAKCSVCGKKIDASEMGFKYCPHCGAKMDGKEDAK